MTMGKLIILELGGKIKNMEMEFYTLKSSIIRDNGSTDIKMEMVIIKIIKLELFILANIKQI